MDPVISEDLLSVSKNIEMHLVSKIITFSNTENGLFVHLIVILIMKFKLRVKVTTKHGY